MKSICKFIFALFISSLPIFSFGDVRKASEKSSPTSEIKIKVEKDWLLLPMSGSQNYRETKILDKDGKAIFSLPTLITSDKVIWRAPVDVSRFKGQELVLQCADLKVSPSVVQVNNPPWTKSYTDRCRPVFHLTAKEGLMSSPCGMFYLDKKWHAFFLWNPYAMNLGAPYFVAHAVSDDLSTWFYEKPIYMPTFDGKSFYYPLGGSAYRNPQSGSIVFAWRFSDGSVKVGSSLDLKSVDFFATIPSLFGGESLPNIFFDDEKKIWVLVCAQNGKVSFAVSANLKEWNISSEFDCDFFVPSLVKVPHSERGAEYILFNGDGRYFIGSFDGSKFSPLEKEYRQIFYGNIYGAQFWRNTQNERLLASAIVPQPENLLRDVGQSFVNTMSLPYEMRVASLSMGKRLRATLIPELVEYFGDATDALGVNFMRFRSNIFSLPDAVGNYFALSFTFDTTESDIVVWGAGVSRFEYNKIRNHFVFRHVEDVLLTQDYTDNFRDGFTNLMMFVDSYDIEALFLNGIAVLFYGDSFLNPEQEIKFGGKGVVYLDKVSRMPILTTTQAQRGKIATSYLECLKREEAERKAKEEVKKQKTEKSE